jgi:hypothetical protein
MSQRVSSAAAAAVLALATAACGSTVPTVNPSPSPSQPASSREPVAPTIHATVGGLALDYPGDWTLAPTAGHVQHFEEVITSPGALASEVCPPDFIQGGGPACAETIQTPAGTAVVQLITWGGPPTPAETVIAQDIATGWQPTSVDGQHAAFLGDTGPDSMTSGAVLHWDVVMPSTSQPSFARLEIRAEFGPGSNGLASAVQAVVASLHIAPATP